MQSWEKVAAWLLLATVTGAAKDDGVLFSCSFARNTCGMDNQVGVRAHWQREYLRLAGRKGFAMVVKGNEANNHFARFVTPNFDTKGATDGCLTFLYFIDGRVPASLACIKQGFVTKYVFATAKKTQDHWEKAQIDVEFLGDQVMFYFEADTKVQDYGNSIVAFTDVQITNKPCHYSQKPTRRYSRLG